MSHDDMPTFGQPGNHKDKKQGLPGDDMPLAKELPPETGLSDQDQKDAVKKVVKFFVIIAAVLIGSALLYRGAVFAWHKYTIFAAETSLQKILDAKLIDAERAKFTKQYDDWVAKVKPDYDQYYPYRSEYEFQKIVGAHKRLMLIASARLGQIEDQIKRVLAEPGKSEAQLQEAMNFWIDWKKDRGILDAERLAVEEERQVKQYFEKIKPKELPSNAPPPAPAVETPPVVNSTIAPVPAPAAAPVLKQSRPKQETAAEKKYLEDVQRALKGDR